MGKLLVILGQKLQQKWCKFQCGWNWLVAKMLFSVKDCPHKLCTCK